MKTWKTVEIGATPEEINMMISEVRGKNCEVDKNKKVAKMLFSSTSTGVKSTVKLVKLGIRDLWKDSDCDRIRYSSIFSRAKEMGLIPCPPEVGLRVLLDNPKIQCNEWLNIGMEPINGSILCVYPINSCQKNPSLSGSDGEWNDDDEDCALMITQWIFIKK